MEFINCIFNQKNKKNTEENAVEENTDEIFDTSSIITPLLVTNYIEEVKKTLKNGDSVVIKSFGNFYVKEIPEHMEDGQNIKAARKLFFKPDRRLKDEI